MARRAGPRLCMGNVAAGGSGQLERRACVGVGEEAWGRQRVREKRPAPRTMEPPWRPLGGQCVPRDPRLSAPGWRPRSSCLFRTRPCKCAHLILNPLRRSPCERGKGWPRQSFTNQRPGNPGARQNVCITHANEAGHLEK